MRKKLKILAVITAMITSLQTGLVASAGNQIMDDSVQVAVAGIVQPYGRYLCRGTCYISPSNGYVTVWGTTVAYNSVSEISVTLTIFKQLSSGAWQSVWSDMVTDYNTDYGDFPKRNVIVSPGYYRVEGTHTVRHNGITETNTSVSATITVQ